MSAAIPARSISASTPTSGSSTSASSRAAPRRSRSSSRASASSAVATARAASAFAASRPRRRCPGRAARRPACSPRQLAAHVAQGQVGQVERALAGQRQVGGEGGVAGQAAQLQAARGQRVIGPLASCRALGGPGRRARPPGPARHPRSARSGPGRRWRRRGRRAPGRSSSPVPRPQVPLAARPTRPPLPCSASHSATSSGPSTSASTSKPSAGPSAPTSARPVRERGLEPLPQHPELQRVEELVRSAPGPTAPGSAPGAPAPRGTSSASSVSWRLRSTSARCSRRLSPARPLTSSTRSTSVRQGAELDHPLGRGLLADARDAGQVVARVAPQRREVGVLSRGQPVLLGDRLRREPGHVADPAAGHQHGHAVADELEASRSPVTISTPMPSASPGWRAWR